MKFETTIKFEWHSTEEEDGRTPEEIGTIISELLSESAIARLRNVRLAKATCCEFSYSATVKVPL